jgi:hypothetical protein
MDWTRGRKDHEEKGHYLLSPNQKGSWNRAIGTHILASLMRMEEMTKGRKAK